MEAFRGRGPGGRTYYSTWRKLGWYPSLFEAFRGEECIWQDLLQHLKEAGVETRSCGRFQHSKFRWQDLLQHLEEVRVETMFCGNIQGKSSGGGSWDGNHVLWKLKDIMVQAAELVTVP